MRKFYKTVIEVVVLSEDEPYSCNDLAMLEYDITEGHFSGVWEVKSSEELSPEEAAKALLAQGSDPEFFRLSQDGENLEEDGEDKPPQWFKNFLNSKMRCGWDKTIKGKAVGWMEPDYITLEREDGSLISFPLNQLEWEE